MFLINNKNKIMGKTNSKGKYVVKVNNHDIYVLGTKKPDTSKKRGDIGNSGDSPYSCGFASPQNPKNHWGQRGTKQLKT